MNIMPGTFLAQTSSSGYINVSETSNRKEKNEQDPNRTAIGTLQLYMLSKRNAFSEPALLALFKCKHKQSSFFLLRYLVAILSF